MLTRKLSSCYTIHNPKTLTTGSFMRNAKNPPADTLSEELPLDENFVEQAEYLKEQQLLDLSADHPDEASIIRRLSVGGAKLLVGPRGCGKTTLLLKAYYRLSGTETLGRVDKVDSQIT
jgi:flagellar biosynthesis GTPase FlhF